MLLLLDEVVACDLQLFMGCVRYGHLENCRKGRGIYVYEKRTVGKHLLSPQKFLPAIFSALSSQLQQELSLMYLPENLGLSSKRRKRRRRKILAVFKNLHLFIPKANLHYPWVL